jgi:hypothetical protein
VRVWTTVEEEKVSGSLDAEKRSESERLTGAIVPQERGVAPARKACSLRGIQSVSEVGQSQR